MHAELSENVKERDDLGDTGVDGRIILRLILEIGLDRSSSG